MSETIYETAERIRKLEIQGARNVAIAALRAVQTLAEQSRAKTKTVFLRELKEAQDVLFSSRETEPLMRNAVRYILIQTQDSGIEKVDALGELVSSNVGLFLQNLEASRERIAEIGAQRIREGMLVFTHCHSSTVTRMIARAKADGKSFSVICTETRPAFQGRITAREMVDLGVQTIFIVDSAARSYMGDADLVFVGADAITSEGNIVNKIGTSTIATLANETRKPFYAVSELLKFDPETLCGAYESIEQRSPNEVWNQAPEGLSVRNPAFDVTPSRYIHGLICEEGVIAPQSIVETVYRSYPWVLKVF